MQWFSAAAKCLINMFPVDLFIANNFNENCFIIKCNSELFEQYLTRYAFHLVGKITNHK